MAKPTGRTVPVLCEFVLRQSVAAPEVTRQFIQSVSHAIDSVKSLCAAELAKQRSVRPKTDQLPNAAAGSGKLPTSGAQKMRQKSNRPVPKVMDEPSLEQITRRYTKQYLAFGFNETIKALERNDALLILYVSIGSSDSAAASTDEQLPSWYPLDAVLSACAARRVAALNVSQRDLDSLFVKPLAFSRCSVVAFRRDALADDSSLFRAALFTTISAFDDGKKAEASDLFKATVGTTRSIGPVLIPVTPKDKSNKRKLQTQSAPSKKQKQ